MHAISSVEFSCSVTSDSLRPHGLQHTRPPCPLQTPRLYSNSCPLSQWYHPSIPSTVVTLSSHLQSFPASGSFPISQFFTTSGQSIGVSASTSVLPVNIQGWFPAGCTGWRVQGTLKSLLQHYSSKASILWHSAFFIVQLSYPYMTTGKTIALTRRTSVSKVMSLLFNMLSRLVIEIWKTQQWPQDWKRSAFIPIPKKDNAKECSNYCTIALISHTSKVMHKIL